MNKVLYTIITGKCDILRDPMIPIKGWDMICFTDNPKLKSKHWKIRLIAENGINDFKKLSRKYKILAHLFLKEYDVSLYIDSYIVPAVSINDFLLEIPDAKFVVKKHPIRSDIFSEAIRIKERERELNQVVNSQIKSYRRQGYKKTGLYENGIMLRHHNDPEVIKLSEAWWKEILTYSYRDQLSLPFIAWKLNFKVEYFTDNISRKYFSRLSKRENRKINKEIIIYEGTPYGENKQYGRALNEFCQKAPEDSWIIIRDRDTMYLTDNYNQIVDVIKQFPDTGIFGCMTNRLGLKWQLVEGMYDETNILKHYEKAVELQNKYYGQVVNYCLPVGGMFIVFNKSTWQKVEFREGNIIGKDNIYFDWDFCKKVQELGMPIRIMRGVYVFHFYRFANKNVKDVSHLIK